LRVLIQFERASFADDPKRGLAFSGDAFHVATREDLLVLSDEDSTITHDADQIVAISHPQS